MPAAPTHSDAGIRALNALRIGEAARSEHADHVVTEVPVALVYNGVPFAVMLATPCDLADFALGFALSEGIVANADEFELVDVLTTGGGITLQGLIPAQRFEALHARRRSLAGRSGCGLCGIEALEDAVRPVPVVSADPRLNRAHVSAGMRVLAAHQPLNSLTGGAHAAAFIAADRSGIVREDVGRHNALDKLIGALALDRNTRASDGFLAITSRASWEIVAKAAHAGIAVIAAISAPTSMAVEAADAAGITLIAFARDAAMNVYTHARRVT
jgi:formate dehydrogenase accessory protein FdhD